MIKPILWLIFSIFTILGLLTFIFDVTLGSSKKSKVTGMVLKVVVAVILIPCFIIIIPNSVVSIVDKIDKTNASTIAELVGTVLSVLVAVGGYIYTKNQDKVQEVHAESGWRKKLLELETEPTYSIGHLIKLNAFINPFNDNQNGIDNYVNQVIINILKQHDISKCVKRVPTNVDSSKFPNNVEKILELPSKISIFDYNIKEDKKKELLSSVEQNEVRRCIHALLKNDWDNITGKAK